MLRGKNKTKPKKPGQSFKGSQICKSNMDTGRNPLFDEQTKHSQSSLASGSTHTNTHVEPLAGGQTLVGAQYLLEHDRAAELGFGGCGRPHDWGAGEDTHCFPEELPLGPSFCFCLTEVNSDVHKGH